EDADLILAADGVASRTRDQFAEFFGPEVDHRPNKFVWLGTTVPYDAFTFYFKENDAGLWRVHAYRYTEEGSTFIVETTHDAWLKAGMDQTDEDQTIAYLESLFAEELAGHKLIKNRSIWRSFPNIRNRSWHHRNMVLLGDAAHTAHLSIGSGTKLAMEDAIVLRDALEDTGSVREALVNYEERRRPEVESLQRAAQVSLEWFENTERYLELSPEQFEFSLLTRSLRVTHENLRKRDPEYVARYDRWFAADQGFDSDEIPAPLFVPKALREQQCLNRIVAAPTRLDAAPDGLVGDDYLVHAGARAMGGAGLVYTGVAAVSKHGRLTPRTPGLYRPDQADQWSDVVDYIRGRSISLTGIRLTHSGPRASIERPWPGEDGPIFEPWELMAASPVRYGARWPEPRAATSDDIEQVVRDYRRAVALADAAGFHVVDLDFADGGLLASFLSPLTNHRDDDYGGSEEARLNLAGRIVAAAREVLAAAKPLGVRICADDGVDGGTTPEVAARVAKRLAEVGADFVTVAAGYTLDGLKPSGQRAYSVALADAVRAALDVPVIAEGGLWSSDDVCSAVAAGRADFCALERALLFDPNFPRRAAARFGVELPWPERYFRARGFFPRD
ncbi:MAG: FAD-dependent monooxygenase, partial [Deltaproteobacteria bacterium]|nr:FAD-dependent monooxygenase [Deltaproteobacteria bacterium]